MIINLRPEWIRRRFEFNHDWLKLYLNDFKAFIMIIDDRVEDPFMEGHFIVDILPQWQEKSSEALSIINSFESDMSPKRIFESPPLTRYHNETIGWLKDLLHSIWIFQSKVKKLRHDALESILEANNAYTNLTKIRQNYLETNNTALFRSHRQAFVEFNNACYKTFITFQKLPSRIEIL